MTHSRVRGASLVEYALGVSLILVATLAVINRLEDSAANELSTNAPRIGTPAELNALPPPGNGNPNIPPGAVPVGDTPVNAHVGGLRITTAQDGSDWTVTVILEVRDSVGTLRSGVTCNASFTPQNGAAVVTDQSDENGECALTQGNMKRNGAGSVPSVQFDVTSLQGTLVTYVPAENTAVLPQVINAP